MFNSKDLTVISVAANEAKGQLFPYMVKSILKFSDYSPKFIVADNGGNGNVLEKNKTNDTIIIKNSSGVSHPSTSHRHGAALNVLMKQVKTEFTAIIEPDCFIFSDSWYKFDDSKFDAKMCIKGNRDGFEYHFMCFMIFKTNLFYNINWCPSPKRITKDNSLYNDSGWEASDLVLKKQIHKLSGHSCRADKAIVFKDKIFVHKSMEIQDNGIPIAAHLFRGSELNRKKGDVGAQLKRWKQIADGLLKT